MSPRTSLVISVIVVPLTEPLTKPQHSAAGEKAGGGGGARRAQIVISSKTFLRVLCVLCGLFFLVVVLRGVGPEILRSSGAVPAYVAGQFREPGGFPESCR